LIAPRITSVGVVDYLRLPDMTYPTCICISHSPLLFIQPLSSLMVYTVILLHYCIQRTLKDTSFNCYIVFSTAISASASEEPVALYKWFYYYYYYY